MQVTGFFFLYRPFLINSVEFPVLRDVIQADGDMDHFSMPIRHAR